MKIAHIIWSLNTGGAETMLVDIVNEQVKCLDVAILVVNNLINQSLFEKIDKRCKVRLYQRKVGSKSLMPWVKLNAFLWIYHPDIIHFHLEGMRRMVFHPAPKVFTIHNMHTSGSEYPKYKGLYAISDAVKKRTKEQGFESTTIWNGIHPTDIVVKEKIMSSSINFRFVCVGRLYTPHKGQDILLKAVSILKNKGITNFHLDLIGEGEYRGQLESFIHESDISEQISFLGQKDRKYIYSHLKDYDLFILPSRSEGFGLTIAEAMCAKVPVIVSNLDGPMEVIGNGKLGLTFISEDEKDLAVKLSNFINEGPNCTQIEEAYKYAINEFDIDLTVKKYMLAYEEVINN